MNLINKLFTFILMAGFSIVFMGSNHLAEIILQRLCHLPEVEVKAIVTQPDRPKGRQPVISMSSIKKLAFDSKILCLQPVDLKEIYQVISTLKPDFIIVCDYAKIIPTEILNQAKFGNINIHPSLLPKYRGASPIQTAILQGDLETGVSFIKMTDKLDAGPILMIKRANILTNDTNETLTKRLGDLAAEYLPVLLKNLATWQVRPEPQLKSEATYCKKFKREDGRIDWKNKTAQEIYNQIRAFIPWPGTFTFWQGKRLKIERANYKDSEGLYPGKVSLSLEEIAIACRDGVILPRIVQLEGKKKMGIEEFIRGYKNFIGSTLD